MPKKYSRQFCKMVAEFIYIQKEGTIKTVEEFGIPLKTVENRVTAYNKDPHCFDDDHISTEQLEAARKTIRKQKETIEI